MLRENYGREFQAAAASATERDLAAEAGPTRARPVTQDNEPQPAMTREAIDRDPWNAVALDLPADADHELLFLVATTARELQSSLSERGSEATTTDQQQLWLDLAARAKERQAEAETQIVALDAAPPPVAENSQAQQPDEPLAPDDIAERVQRILDDPTREADELDQACWRPYRSAARPTSRPSRQPPQRPRTKRPNPLPATTSRKTEAPAPTR